MSQAGGVKLADVTEMSIDIKNPIAIAAADTLKAINAAGAMDPLKQVDENVTSWKEGCALFTSGDISYVNRNNKWPENLWGEGDLTRYGYVPFPRPDGTELKDQRIGLGGTTNALVMAVGRNYDGYGPECTDKNIYRAMVEIFQKTKEYQLVKTDETNHKRAFAEKYTESDDSIQALIWMLNNINQIGFYDPFANAENPIANTGDSIFSTAINNYIMGLNDSYTNAVEPLIPILTDQLRIFLRPR